VAEPIVTREDVAAGVAELDAEITHPLIFTILVERLNNSINSSFPPTGPRKRNSLTTTSDVDVTCDICIAVADVIPINT